MTLVSIFTKVVTIICADLLDGTKNTFTVQVTIAIAETWQAGTDIEISDARLNQFEQAYHFHQNKIVTHYQMQSGIQVIWILGH